MAREKIRNCGGQMEQYGKLIMMDGRTFKADNRKELEQAIIDSGQEPAVAKASARLLWESMLKTQMEINNKME